jgi:hypothetical protein
MGKKLRTNYTYKNCLIKNYLFIDTESLSSRRGEKKLDSKKLSALEKLKKGRAGEMVPFLLIIV